MSKTIRLTTAQALAMRGSTRGSAGMGSPSARARSAIERIEQLATVDGSVTKIRLEELGN